MRCYFRLFLWIFTFIISCFVCEAYQCPDGKLPLFINSENSEPFSCTDECPQGYDCKHPDSIHPIGICCPNLDKLYVSSSESSTEVFESTAEAVEGGGERFNEIVEAISTIIPPITDGIEGAPITLLKSPDRKFLNTINEKELSFAPGENEYGFDWPPNNQKVDESMLSENHLKLTSIEKSVYPFTCKRQKFEVECLSGVKKMQVVVRWYKKNGECVAYPFGFCSGNTIRNDKTMRTREECIALCIQKKFSVLEAASHSSTALPLLNSTKLTEPEGPINDGIFLNTPIELIELFPPGYGPEFEEDKTRVILHSNIIDPIAVYLPNTYSGVMGSVYDTVNNAEEKKEDNEPDNETVQLLKMLLGPKRSKNNEGDYSKSINTCHKTIPYRLMCPTGAPTQFTIRWYVKSGSCTPYPYGYCRGELISDETAIRTKETCKLLCLGVPNRTRLSNYFEHIEHTMHS